MKRIFFYFIFWIFVIKDLENSENIILNKTKASRSIVTKPAEPYSPVATAVSPISLQSVKFDEIASNFTFQQNTCERK